MCVYQTIARVSAANSGNLMIVPYIQKSPHSIPKIVAIISRLTCIVYLIVSTALNFDGGGCQPLT